MSRVLGDTVTCALRVGPVSKTAVQPRVKWDGKGVTGRLPSQMSAMEAEDEDEPATEGRGSRVEGRGWASENVNCER